MENVSFWYGLYADYVALQAKDASALYCITDKNVIYKGTTLMTDRYSITVRQIDGANVGIRLTDKITGQYYDLPYLALVQNLLNDGLSLRYNKTVVGSNADLLGAIGATEGIAASGGVEAGTVFRVEIDDPDPYSRVITFDPVQNGSEALVARHHDLIIALYDLENGEIQIPKDSSTETISWKNNKELFAVIPTDLVDLVSANGNLGLNKVILGNNGHVVKAMAFNGANKILRTNSTNDGVEWVAPETVQNVISWEQIPSAQ